MQISLALADSLSHRAFAALYEAAMRSSSALTSFLLIATSLAPAKPSAAASVEELWGTSDHCRSSNRKRLRFSHELICEKSPADARCVGLVLHPGAGIADERFQRARVK